MTVRTLVWIGLALATLSLAAESHAAGRKYALIVGVSEYRAGQPLPRLGYTENDANRLAEVFKAAGYDVTLMTQATAGEPGKALLAPNADFIRDQLDALLDNPFLKAEEDVVVVALSGHGVHYDEAVVDAQGKPVLDAAGEPQTRPRFYFCPADTDLRNYADVVPGSARESTLERANDVTARNHLLDLDELYQGLERCKAGGKLLLVDACRNDPSKPTGTRSARSLTLPAIPDPPGGVAAFFACSRNEEAIEDAELGHGVFFHYVIEALSGEADASTSGRPADGEITVTELVNYVPAEVYDYVRTKHGGARQTPDFKGSFRLSIPLLKALDRFIGTKAGEVRTLVAEPKIDFCWCPPGSFRMGSPQSDSDAENDERPQVDVVVRQGFWLGRTEVTQHQWQAVMETRSLFDLPGSEYVQIVADRPVTFVSWEEATSFCRKLTEFERRGGRLSQNWEYALPTDAQWEYACRAGTKTRFSFGDDASWMGEHAWYMENAYNAGEKYAHAVATKKPNPWGLHDVHGNVAELCRDLYAAEGEFRNFRNATWITPLQFHRSAVRSGLGPSERSHDIGFRVACVPSGQ